MKKFLTQALFDAALLGSLAAWQFAGSDGAGNLFVFLAWFSIVVALLIGLTKAGRKDIRENKTNPARRAWLYVRNAIVLISAAWLGMYFLASMWAFSWMLIEGVRTNKDDPS